MARLFDKSALRRSVYGMSLHWQQNYLDYNRLLLAPKKAIGGAVQRNQVKRWLRHDYMVVGDRLIPGYDLAVLLYPISSKNPREQRRSALIQLLKSSSLLRRD